jgi:hypothetical protein
MTYNLLVGPTPGQPLVIVGSATNAGGISDDGAQGSQCVTNGAAGDDQVVLVGELVAQ